MTDLSYFESRTGKLSCNAEEVFAFVTDIRNFERFIPGGLSVTGMLKRSLAVSAYQCWEP